MARVMNDSYWMTTGALAALIKAAPEDVLIEAAEQLDGGNSTSYLLRGLAYITHLINAQQQDDVFPEGRERALEAVSAFTELLGAFVDLDHQADCIKVMRRIAANSQA